MKSYDKSKSAIYGKIVTCIIFGIIIGGSTFCYATISRGQMLNQKTNEIKSLYLDGAMEKSNLEWGICQYSDMDATKCPVKSIAITSNNWWYECVGDDDKPEENVWCCSEFSNNPRVVRARPRGINE
jgi:hypothetical protein